MPSDRAMGRSTRSPSPSLCTSPRSNFWVISKRLRKRSQNPLVILVADELTDREHVARRAREPFLPRALHPSPPVFPLERAKLRSNTEERHPSALVSRAVERADFFLGRLTDGHDPRRSAERWRMPR